MDLYHGNLRAIDAEGKKIFDQVDYQDYVDYIAEEVRSWSYMKFPFITSLGPENGWYRVGPLARINTARLHRHADGRGRAQGVHGADRRASPTTSPWPTTGRA